jgi:hypothetical protein
MLPNISLTRLNGETEQMSDYAGKVLLIVNVASRCGFTNQYAGLQSIYAQFQDRGFEVLGFPCNQFGGQEPGSATEIEQFCSTRYQTSFPCLKKPMSMAIMPTPYSNTSSMPLQAFWVQKPSSGISPSFWWIARVRLFAAMALQTILPALQTTSKRSLQSPE